MNRVCKWHIGIAIPARNEERLLPRCLRSVLEAKAQLNELASVDIIVVDDSSSDRTFKIARKMLQSEGKVIRTEAGAVGEARALAAKLLLERYQGCSSSFWLANTDADCIVPPTWLVDQWRLAQIGIEAVAGTVSVDTFEEHGPETPQRFKLSYRIEPDGSHPHIHGANLGVRGDVYVQAGGWKPLETAEDHDLWQRLSFIHARQHSTSSIQVQTSGRRVGRAPHGFADALAAHNETAA